MTATTFTGIDEFAAAVRAALSDLPADEVEDLTDGLEADLAERAADTATGIAPRANATSRTAPDGGTTNEPTSAEFGDPVAYAEELRSAAGLPHRSTPSPAPASMDAILATAARDAAHAFRELYDHPLVHRLGDFFVTLRPVWWLFRAFVFYGIATWLLGMSSLSFNLATILLAIGCAIVSIQFGRGRWLPRRWMRKTLLAVNVILVLVSPIVLIAANSAFGSQINNAYADGQSESYVSSNGLSYNGHQVTNIFAYDAQGNPLTNVQLFTQSGSPLYTVENPRIMTLSDSGYLVPNNEVVGRLGWNVYPLLRIPADQVGDSGRPVSTAVPTAVRPPFRTVQPLASELTATPSATATPAPTATPSATETPTPSPTPRRKN